MKHLSARMLAILTEGFRGFSSVPPGKCVDSTLKLRHDRFLQLPLLFIIHLSSSNSTLLSLNYWRNVGKRVLSYLATPSHLYGAGLAQAIWCLATGWTTGRSGFDPRRGQRIFPLTSVSRPALGPNQPPVQWVQGGPFPGAKRARSVTLITHPRLVPRSRMSRS
jgi:hypothetical protein